LIKLDDKKKEEKTVNMEKNKNKTKKLLKVKFIINMKDNLLNYFCYKPSKKIGKLSSSSNMQ